MWTEGYVTEIDYTHGYYRELAPGLLRFACAARGAYLPDIPAPRYLELGFGQGVSINVHAAACPGEYWGTDFNPAQAANAQRLLSLSGAKATLLDQSFAELAARTDLPTFDIIALHGIWSWISPENQRHIVDIARRHLAVGGVLYISYNTQPGWAASAPVRHLMRLHGELAGAATQGVVGKIDAALQFAQGMADENAFYFQANPMAAQRLKTLAGQGRNYLAHEYMNADWHPMYFSEVAGLLDTAKLSFAASAHLIDHIDGVNLSAPARQRLGAIQHPVLRESLRDYYVNQQFRRDVFVKGLRVMGQQEQAAALRGFRVALLIRPEDVPLKVKGALGEAGLQEAVYTPVLEALAPDKGPRSLGELEQALAGKVSLAALREAVVALVGSGHAAIAQDEDAIRRAVPHCDRLNLHICAEARYKDEVGFLASPVVGGALPVPRFHKLFLLALRLKRQTPEEWAAYAFEVLSQQGQRIVKDGKTLETPEENQAELVAQARQFANERLPMLRALKVGLAK